MQAERFHLSSQAPRDSKHYEEWLKKEVRHQLVMLLWFSVFDNLEYSVNGGTLTLEGQVVRPVTKSDAESAVKSIEGVEKVVNNIEVLPPSPNDDRVRQATFRAIYSFPGFERCAIQAVPPLHIIVKNGARSAHGVVANEADKSAAEIRAKGVPGAFSVTNKLSVEKKEEPKEK